MEIVKSLDINKRYNKVLNGSIVMAKNMRVNEDNSALELDEGFKDVLSEAIEKYNEDNNTALTFDPIVGIIECPKEVVLFTYSHLPSPNGTSNIYRLKEIGDNEVELVKCNTAWKYNGGYRNGAYVNSHINGTYTYNVKGELIVTIGEYTDDNQDVPLRIINLDLDTHTNQVDDYNVAPNVPIANLKLMGNTSRGSMPTGTYYFFIRYEITKNEYTNWFPIGVPYRAINEESKTLFNHNHDLVNHDQLTVTVNNTHKDVVNNPWFNLTISETNFKRYQIAYILQHGSSTVARLYKTFTLSSYNLIIFDANYKEEIAIEELLKNPLGLYNVHCLASFENRTYIANYKEEDVAQDSALQTIANNITVTGIIGSAMHRYGFNGLNNSTDYGESASLYTIHDSRVIDEDEGGGDEHILVFRATDVFFDEQDADGNNYYRLRNMGAPINLGIHGISQYTALSDDTLINKSFLFGSTTGLNSNNRLVNDNGDNDTPAFYLFFPPYNKIVNITVELTVAAVDGSAADANILEKTAECINASLSGTISKRTDGLYKIFSFVVNVPSSGTTTLGNDEGYSAFAFDFGSSAGTRTQYIKDIYINSNTTTIARRNTDTTTTNNTSTSQTTLKDDFTFNEPNSRNSISLYNLLTVEHFGTWLFDSTVESNISIDDKVKIGSANNLFIQNLNIYLDDSQYPGGITKGNYFKGFYQDDTRRFEVSFNNFTLYSNNNTYKSIDFDWGDSVVRDLDNLDWVSNLLGLSISIGSFDPEEKYQFYIHFVRANGTHTHAYPISDTLNPRRTYGVYWYYPTFDNITVPNGYIGYFISYKQISNRRLYSGVIVSLGGRVPLTDGSWHVRVRSIETELALTPYRGAYAVLEKDDGSSYALSNTNAIFINGASILLGNVPSVVQPAGTSLFTEKDEDLENFGSLGLPGFIDLELNAFLSESDISNKHVISVFSEDPDSSIVRDYSSSADIIPLGPVIKASGSNLSFTADETYDINYPVYIEKETTYFFNHRIYFDETQETPKYYNTVGDSYTLDDLHIKYLNTYTYLKYTKHIIKALEIKKEPSIGTTVWQAIGKNYFNTNTYVLPQDSQDLYNYPSEYFKRVYKSYLTFEDITYSETHFTKTIRRSNVLSDESVINSLRNFNANQYKFISSNKGNITALVALGTDLLIHTENTLFRLSKQAILEADSRSVAVTAGDLFNIDPQEIFTANHGYGGLQVENNWCTNEHGYWFYDRDNHKLFNLDNGQLNDMSEPIIKYLNSIYPVDVKFNTDFKNHRVLISFKENNLDTHNPVTFSFNVLTKSFISIHDFYFGVRCNTKNNVYFLGYLGYRDPATRGNILNIYKFNGVANRAYANLSSVAANFPEFVDADWDTNQCAAYIDIIFNNQYPIIRNLESINYLLGYKEEFNDFDYKLFEDREKYSGNYIEIYTDSTDSRILDLSQGNEVNNYNDYKHPHYNKGSWQFNYFRNIVSKELTLTQLNDYIARLGLTESALPYIINGITDNDNPSQIDQVIRPSDERSLIYGKYIIIRFIFTDTNDKQIRFEDVNVNVNSY